MRYKERMTTKYTTNGIMVRDGKVLSDDVTVSTYTDEQDHYLNLAYTDENGIYNESSKSFNEYKIMVDRGTSTIDGILSRQNDWYLFWNNKKGMGI
jgi:hypothetical protein